MSFENLTTSQCFPEKGNPEPEEVLYRLCGNLSIPQKILNRSHFNIQIKENVQYGKGSSTLKMKSATMC